MALRTIAFAPLFFPQFLIATPSVTAQAIGQEGRSSDGRWSVGPYSTRDFLERNGPHELLNLAIVRKEMRVTEAQSTDLKALQTKVQESPGVKIKLSPEDLNGQDLMAVIQTVQTERHDQKQEMLKLGTSQILNLAQTRRLREISLQLEGILAVARPEIQESLNMDQSQRVNIEKIKREYDQSKIAIYRKNSAIRKNQPLPTSKDEADRLRADNERNEAKIKLYEKTKAEFDAMRERAEAQIKRWLTRRQEAKFKKLCGEPFKELEMLTVPGFDWKREELRRQKEESKAKSPGTSTGRLGQFKQNSGLAGRPGRLPRLPILFDLGAWPIVHTQGRSSIACSTRSAMPTDPYKVELGPGESSGDFGDFVKMDKLGN